VRHREILKYYVPVESVDTSVPVTSAGFGSYWNGTKWVKSRADEDFFYDCLKRSYSALRRTMNPDRLIWSPHARNRLEDYQEWFDENHPDADLWGRDEHPPLPRYQRDDPHYSP
jgi:hypothetical protein